MKKLNHYLRMNSLHIFSFFGVFVLSLFLISTSYGQGTLPWVEDFDLPDSTQSDNGPTAWSAERGDGLTFWVVGGQFVVNDDNGNDPPGTLTTGIIDISSASSVSVSLDVSRSDGLDNGQDYVRFYAIIDGGDPILLDEVDGKLHKGVEFATGEVIKFVNQEISGSTLQLVITSWLSAGSEYYYFDNLSVTENFAWVEDFDLPDSTQVDDGPTAWNAERGDGLTFWVVGGQFVINDDNGNDPPGTLTTEVLDISSAEKILVSLDVSMSSGLDNGQDYVKLYVIVDGGDPVLVDSINGKLHNGVEFAEGEVVTLSGRSITGSTLQIVVKAWLSAGSEFYYMDNLSAVLETAIIYELLTEATGGSITLDPPGGTYEAGTAVTVTAIPDEGFYFDGWGGDFAGIDTASVTVTMDSAINVSVDFAVSPTFTITTNVTNGNVVLSPPGGTYFEGTSVVVHAKPYVGFEFVEWTGDLTGSENPTSIVVDADKNITAVIEEIEAYTLSVSGTNGSVTVSPLKDLYGPGEAVVLIATADADYRFKNWEGDLTGTENPTAIFMNADKNITAVFELIPPSYTLTLGESPNGSITLDPPGGTYDEGTVVTLTAVPDQGYAFAEWGGDASGSVNPGTITMDGDKTVSAVFTDATGVDEFNSAPSLLMYPNPANSELHIRVHNLGNNNAEIMLRDVVGKAVYHQLHSGLEITIDVSSLDAGIYFMQMKAGDHVITRKLNIVK